MDDFGCPQGNFTSDYSVIDADYYDPFEHVKKDECGNYVIMEDGRKLRFPSRLKVRVEIAKRDTLLEIA